MAVQSITDRYVELFEGITGDKFIKEETADLAKRIESNINAYLNK